MANEKRLIDANALMDAFRSYMAERYDKEKCVSEDNCNACDRVCLWRRTVMNAPTVDAVEVCRCKDCKWCDDFDVNGIGLCWENDRYVHGDDFCSDGERREGE